MLNIYSFHNDGMASMNLNMLRHLSDGVETHLLPQDLSELKTCALLPGIVWFRYYAHIAPDGEHNGKANWFSFGDNNQLTVEFVTALKILQDRGLHIAVDYLWESENSETPFRNELVKLMKSADIDFDGVTWMNNNAWQRGRWTYHGDVSYHHLSAPWWMWYTHYQLYHVQGKTEVYAPASSPTHDILCMNRRGRRNKITALALLDRIVGIDRVNFSLCTLHDRTRYGIDPSSIEHDFITKTLGQDIQNFESIQLEGDALYGSGVADDKYLFYLNPKWYETAPVSLLTETAATQDEMYAGEKRFSDSIHLTEKTFKTLYMGHPFVISGQARSLERIRDLGFETYSSTVDESYDITGDEVRIHQAIAQVPALVAGASDSETRAIADHNQALMRDFEQMKASLEQHFLSPISEKVHS